MKTAYFYLTPAAEELARRLAASHPGDLYGKEDFKNKMKDAFGRYDNLVCIMATGIVVRTLAPLIFHKTSDPAVVVMDQKGDYAISLLSGHLGGANDLAREMAEICGGQPVITTGTDVAGKISFDSFAKKNDLGIQNIGQLRFISGNILEDRKVIVYTNYEYPEITKADYLTCLPVPEDPAKGPEAPAVVIDEGFTFSPKPDQPVLYLRPRTICAGIGCKKNREAQPIEEALRQTLKEEGLSPLSLKCIATIPLKAEEPGIIETANRMGVPMKIIPTEEIEALDIASMGIATSDFVASKTGVLSVSTASAYLASGRGQILRDKAKYQGITVALAKSSSGQEPG